MEAQPLKPLKPLKTVEDVDARLSSFVALRRVSRKSDLWEQAEAYTEQIDTLLKQRLSLVPADDLKEAA